MDIYCASTTGLPPTGPSPGLRTSVVTNKRRSETPCGQLDISRDKRGKVSTPAKPTLSFSNQQRRTVANDEVSLRGRRFEDRHEGSLGGERRQQ